MMSSPAELNASDAEQPPAIHKMENFSQTHDLLVTIHIVCFAFVIRSVRMVIKCTCLQYVLSLLSTHLHRPVLLPAVHSLLADQRAVRCLVVL